VIHTEEDIRAMALAARDAFNDACGYCSENVMAGWCAAARAVLSAQPETERTPVNVLRAMWHAYSKTALDAEVAYFSLANDVQAHLAAEHRDEMVDAVDAVRGELSAMLAGNHTRFDWPQWIHADYEARLRGERPMGASPLEV
jgi:hypothetical protein